MNIKNDLRWPALPRNMNRIDREKKLRRPSPRMRNVSIDSCRKRSEYVLHTYTQRTLCVCQLLSAFHSSLQLSCGPYCRCWLAICAVLANCKRKSLRVEFARGWLTSEARRSVAIRFQEVGSFAKIFAGGSHFDAWQKWTWLCANCILAISRCLAITHCHGNRPRPRLFNPLVPRGCRNKIQPISSN